MSTTATQRVHNFSAGPAVLPLSVLEKAQKDLLCLPGAGASILEISHRSKQFDAIIKSAENNLRKLLGLDDDWAVLFLQGGASLQFSMLAMNFLEGRKAGYVRCGAWAKKAISEAKKHGQVEIVWDGQQGAFKTMPSQSELKVDQDLAYLHITSNETIEGVQFHYDPDTGKVPLVCDASSDFLHRPLDVSKYAMIYAGAQKNVGPAGCTLVLVRKSFLATQVDKTFPTMLNYKVMADKESLYNTPPAFSIYVIDLVTQWLLNDIGGLDAIHQRNQKKADMLYTAIDNSGGFYRGHAAPEWRSLMNVTFRLPSEELEAKFVKEAEAQGLSGLKGHRDVGGLRASIYNAFEPAGVQALVDFMADFQRRNG
ncbi:MAG: 3-phosphoserine/phosphohydroxythreonine transaminase [Candidatus Eremiobacteraeota bacterium]|nr:3-phosphoserine/phosphohydroxythreonine transaminase [Candidatus Eremiobacteraeota bacterium]